MGIRVLLHTILLVGCISLCYSCGSSGGSSGGSKTVTTTRPPTQHPKPADNRKTCKIGNEVVKEGYVVIHNCTKAKQYDDELFVGLSICGYGEVMFASIKSNSSPRIEKLMCI